MLEVLRWGDLMSRACAHNFVENNMNQSKLFCSVAAIGFIAGLVGGLGVTQLPAFKNSSASVVTSQDRGEPSRAPVGSETDDRVIAVVERASPSVVSIQIRKVVSRRNSNPFSPLDFFSNSFDNGFFVSPPQSSAGSSAGKGTEQVVGGGTGFIVTEDGMVLTNRHVVSDEGAHYVALTSTGQEVELTILARDPLNDLAVAHLAGDKKYVPLTLGDSSSVRIGQTVIAIGNTLSEYQNTVTKGVVSGVGRRVVAGSSRAGDSEVIEEAIQTDAAINPGNSGGPLLTLDGTVIGINTAINEAGQSIGFAIPSLVGRQVIDSVRTNGRIVRPWLGVRYVMIDKDYATQYKLQVDHGALIVKGETQNDPSVIPGSPAQKAGLEGGDIITAVDGKSVSVTMPLGRLISMHKPGDQITITLLRQGKEKTTIVTLDEYKLQ